VSVDAERRLSRGVADRLLEPVVRERLDSAAVPADEVVVVISTGSGRLIVRSVGAKVEPVHEPEPCERLERPVDTRDPNAWATGSNAVVDLLCRQAAPLASEGFDHRRPRPAGLVSGLTQDGFRMVRPAHGWG
jgi:hypothetical protein